MWRGKPYQRYPWTQNGKKNHKVHDWLCPSWCSMCQVGHVYASPHCSWMNKWMDKKVVATSNSQKTSRISGLKLKFQIMFSSGGAKWPVSSVNPYPKLNWTHSTLTAVRHFIQICNLPLPRCPTSLGEWGGMQDARPAGHQLRQRNLLNVLWHQKETYHSHCILFRLQFWNCFHFHLWPAEQMITILYGVNYKANKLYKVTEMVRQNRKEKGGRRGDFYCREDSARCNLSLPLA